MRLSAKIAGVELDGDDVRVVLVRTGSRRPVILEAHTARAVYGEPSGRFEAMVAAVRQATGALKTRPACFILCVSGVQGVARILTVPFRGRKRVSASVAFELEPYLAVPIEEMVVDYSVIREVDGKTETLAVAMRETALEEQVAILKAAGIDAEGINIDAAGLTALWYGRQSGKVGLTAVLHVREQGTILAVVNEQVLTYIRYLSVPAARFLSNPAAAARDVQNSLRAFLAGWETGAAIQGLCITGVALDAEAHAIFEEGVSAPVRYEQLSEGLKGADLLSAPLPLAAQAVPSAAPAPVEAPALEGAAPDEVAEEVVPAPALEPAIGAVAALGERLGCNHWEPIIGCAMAASGGGFDYDFRKGKLSRADALRGVVVHAVFSSCLALLALLGYCAYCYADYRHNSLETERLGSEAWELYTKAFPAQAQGQKRPEKDVGGIRTEALFNDAIKEASKRGPIETSSILELYQKPTLLDILSEISAVMPAGKAQITDFRLTGSGRSPRLEIRGEESDPAAVNEAFEKLKESKILKVEGEPKHMLKDEKNTFQITAVPQ